MKRAVLYLRASTVEVCLFERAMIQERVRAGLARAKSEGKRLGRPWIAPELEERISKTLATPGRPGARSRSGSGSIPARCNGLAALALLRTAPQGSSVATVL
jgi:hypothetical protein